MSEREADESKATEEEVTGESETTPSGDATEATEAAEGATEAKASDEAEAATDSDGNSSDEADEDAPSEKEDASDGVGEEEASTDEAAEADSTESEAAGSADEAESDDDAAENVADESVSEDEASDAATDGIIEVRYFGTTDVGLIREHNEDNLVMVDLDAEVRDLEENKPRSTILGERGLVLAVCDGMGGAAAGEVASQMAVDTIHEVMQAGGVPDDRDMLAHRLVFAIEEAGARIFSAAKMDRNRRGMGTTSTVAGLVDKVLFVGQVGDSRCYILRDGELSLITKDQSLVNQLIEAGQLTEEEAEAFEHSNIILQALGTTEEVSVDLTFVELRRGDRIMLCSDGLSGLVHHEMMAEVMRESDSIEDIANQLVELANAGGGHDNITCIVADFGGDGLPANDGSIKPAYNQYPLPPLEHPVGHSVKAREPAIKSGVRKPGADVKRPVHRLSEDGGSTPEKSVWPMMVVLAIIIGIIVYFFLSPPDAPDSNTVETVNPVAETTESEEEAPEVYSVDVVTDIVGGELFVDGESRGPLDEDGPTTIALEAGAYRLEARVGGSSLAAEMVTVEGEMRVELLLPAGAEGVDEVDVEGDPLDGVSDGDLAGDLNEDEVEGENGGDASEEDEGATAEEQPQRRPETPVEEPPSTAMTTRTEAPPTMTPSTMETAAPTMRTRPAAESDSPMTTRMSADMSTMSTRVEPEGIPSNPFD